MQTPEQPSPVSAWRNEWLRRAGGGVLAGVGVSLLAATNAKVRVTGTPLLGAAAEAGSELFLEPLGLALLVAPFALLAILAPVFVFNPSSWWRWSLVVIGAIVLAAFYFEGFIGSEVALQQRKWTAAALSVGFIPLVSLFFMLGAALVAALVKGLSRTDAQP